MSGKDNTHGGCVEVRQEYDVRYTIGGMTVLVPPGLLPDGACDLKLRPKAAEATPKAPVRQTEAANIMVDYLDRWRAHAPTVKPLSAPAARQVIRRAIEKGRLPHVGEGDECRIGRNELSAWLLAWMSANVFSIDAETAAETVEAPDADEPDEERQADIARNIAEARARKEAQFHSGRRNGDH